MWSLRGASALPAPAQLPGGGFGWLSCQGWGCTDPGPCFSQGCRASSVLPRLSVLTPEYQILPASREASKVDVTVPVEQMGILRTRGLMGSTARWEVGPTGLWLQWGKALLCG